MLWQCYYTEKRFFNTERQGIMYMTLSLESWVVFIQQIFVCPTHTQY